MSIAIPSFRGAIAVPGWVKNELWRIARAVPSLDLRFAENRSLVDAVTGQQLVTFSRTGSGTFVGSNGVLQTAAADVPRFDHDPVTGQSLGLLVEEQRTNLLLRSEELDNATWTKTGSSVFANSALAPSNETTADTVIEDTSTGGHVVLQSVPGLPDSTVYTASMFFKPSGRNWVALTLVDKAGVSNRVWFNVSTGTQGTTNGTVSAFFAVAYPNGAWRLAVSASTGTGGGSVQVRASLGSADNTASYTGNGTSGVIMWGAQIEAGSFPTSYIPTTTAAVTRAADVASITGTAFSSWYRQDEGTVFSDCVGTHSATQVLVNIGATAASTGASSITLASNLASSQKRVRVRDAASADQASFALGASSSGSRTRIVAAIKADDFAASLDGGAAVTDTAGTVPTVALMEIGSAPSGVSLGAQLHRRLTYWPQRLPNSILQTITQ